MLRPRITLLTALLGVVLGAATQAAGHAGQTKNSSSVQPLAFIDVTLVSMNRNETVEHQTVLVERDRIVAIGPATVIRVPNSAQHIVGNGRYLMPGLIDMTVHFRRLPSPTDTGYSQFADYRERNDDMGVLLVANGVTSVRQTHGHPVGDELLERSRGDWLGPTIYSTGPATDGDPPIHPFLRIVTNPADAPRIVAEDKAKGYVAVKVYDGLSLPVYEAIVAAAANQKIDVVGKIPEAVGLARVIAAGQATIENTDVYLYSLQRGAYAPHPEMSWHDLFQGADFAQLTTYADEMRRRGIWSCPAIVLSDFNSKNYAHSAEMKYLPAAFRTALHAHWREADEPSYEEENAFAIALVKRLHERGVGLLLGTDTYLVVPGFSAIRELEYFVAAGLSPYEALQSGTINAARALHLQDILGTIDVGKRADLILLDKNPLTDVSNIRNLVGVALRGRWLPRRDLQARLAIIEKSVATQ